MRKRASADHGERKAARLVLAAGAKTRRKKSVPLEAGVQVHIGNLLRAMYDSALREPVPQRFLDLLREMDAKVEAAAGTPATEPTETE